MLPVAFAIALVASIWLRYTGPWAETDTVAVTRTVRGVIAEQTIEPPGLAYSNGFNYPVLAAMVSEVTGLPVRTVQTSLLQWMLPITALVAFVAFRAITGSGRIGAICALLLLIQADFLFVTQRGSHEKVTWLLVLMVVFGLVRGFRQPRLGHVVPWVLVVYLAGFAIICTNVFFASSFVTTVALSLAAGLVLARWILRDREARPILARFGYVFITLGILTYLFMTLLYPTARSNLTELESAADKVAVLYLGAEAPTTTTTPEEEALPPGFDEPTDEKEEVPFSPYDSIASVWVSQSVFLILTGFTWILLIYASISWVFVTLRFFRGGVQRDDVPYFLAWAFATAAGAQIAASVVADYAEVFGGNLQLRLFPAFTLYAIPMVVMTLRLPSKPVRSRLIRLGVPALSMIGLSALATAFPGYLIVILPIYFAILTILARARVAGRLRPLLIGVGTVAFAGFALAATLKATNDPLVSNRWLFYTPSEATAIEWGNDHLTGERTWNEFDERLNATEVLLTDDSNVEGEGSARWMSGVQNLPLARYILLSDVTVDRTVRQGNPAPNVRPDDIIYDNGSTIIAHRVPVTPFQP